GNVIGLPRLTGYWVHNHIPIQVNDLAPVEGQREIGCPREAFPLHIPGAQSDFEAAVVHLSQVVEYIPEASHVRQLACNQHVVRLHLVQFEVTAEYATKHRKVDTHVKGLGAFPFESRVGHPVCIKLRHVRGNVIYDHNKLPGCQCGEGVIAVDTPVTVRTVRYAQFQVVKPPRLEEWFFADSPSSCY